jgi:hypothetical protein
MQILILEAVNFTVVGDLCSTCDFHFEVLLFQWGNITFNLMVSKQTIEPH